jgi:hypothetical protein
MKQSFSSLYPSKKMIKKVFPPHFPAELILSSSPRPNLAKRPNGARPGRSLFLHTLAAFPTSSAACTAGLVAERSSNQDSPDQNRAERDHSLDRPRTPSTTHA